MQALRGGEGPLSGPLECREGCVYVLEVEMTDLGPLVGTSVSSVPSPSHREL